MNVRWRDAWNIILPVLISVVAVSTFVLSTPLPDNLSRKEVTVFHRQPKTFDMMKNALNQVGNGGNFPGMPVPFPSLKNLFKVNGTHLTWVPLGSLIFNNNGKIIGG